MNNKMLNCTTTEEKMLEACQLNQVVYKTFKLQYFMLHIFCLQGNILLIKEAGKKWMFLR